MLVRVHLVYINDNSNGIYCFRTVQCQSWDHSTTVTILRSKVHQGDSQPVTVRSKKNLMAVRPLLFGQAQPGGEKEDARLNQDQLKQKLLMLWMPHVSNKQRELRCLVCWSVRAKSS